MYFAKKSEYNDIREKSFLQWLDEMEKHDDVAVRWNICSISRTKTKSCRKRMS